MVVNTWKRSVLTVRRLLLVVSIHCINISVRNSSHYESVLFLRNCRTVHVMKISEAVCWEKSILERNLTTRKCHFTNEKIAPYFYFSYPLPSATLSWRSKLRRQTTTRTHLRSIIQLLTFGNCTRNSVVHSSSIVLISSYLTNNYLYFYLVLLSIHHLKLVYLAIMKNATKMRTF